MLYIGPKIPRGMIQQSLQFAATESHLCGEPALSISILYFSTPWDRYLTKICDQVVALLSAEQSASVVLNDEDSDLESIDVDVGESDRLFKFEVAKTNEQEEGAVSRPSFQVHIPLFFRPITNLFKMNSRHILHYAAPYESTINPSTFLPRLCMNCPGVLDSYLCSASNSIRSFSPAPVRQNVPNSATVGTSNLRKTSR